MTSRNLDRLPYHQAFLVLKCFRHKILSRDVIHMIHYMYFITSSDFYQSAHSFPEVAAVREWNKFSMTTKRPWGSFQRDSLFRNAVQPV